MSPTIYNDKKKISILNRREAMTGLFKKEE